MSDFKLQTWHLIAIGLIACIMFGIITIPGWESDGPILPGPGPSDGTTPAGTDLVIVSKPLKFIFKHKYGGAAATGTGGYLYESDGVTLLEGASNSISSGTWTTSNGYASNSQLVLKYVYDTSNDDILWVDLIVPKMQPADAESLTINAITIDMFGLPTLTDNAKSSTASTAIGDAGNWNKTTGANPGADVATCTYEWYVAADNTGYIASHDPQYPLDLKAVLWVKVFGTNYELVILSGFDGAYEKGSSMYYYKVLDPTEITRYKVGNNYVYDGAGKFTWTVDLTGYSGDAADMQIYLEVYSDPEYHKTYGSYGPYAVELAEQTINLID